MTPGAAARDDGRVTNDDGLSGSPDTAPGTDPGTAPGTTPLTGHIQRLIQRVRAFDVRRPLVWDGLLTTSWVLFAVLDVTSGGWRTVALDPDVSGTLVLLMSVAFSTPLLWRRTHPLTVLALMAPVSLVNAWSGAVIQAAFLQEIVVFNVALRLPGRALAWAGALVAAPLVAARCTARTAGTR